MNDETQNTATAFFAVLVGWLVIVAGIAFIVNVQAATYALAGSLGLLAIGRAVLPQRFVPRVRSTVIDVVTLLAFAAALTYFAQWGDAAAIVPV